MRTIITSVFITVPDRGRQEGRLRRAARDLRREARAARRGAEGVQIFI